MDRTRREAPALFEAVLELPHGCATRPQVSGLSMGGLIAQMVFAENRSLASMVSVVGRSSFLQADEWCRQAQQGTWCDSWCAEHATQSQPGRFTDRPVLFIDGGLDTDCPAATNAETVRLINAHGGRAEHFVDAEVGHAFSPTMRARHGETFTCRYRVAERWDRPLPAPARRPAAAALDVRAAQRVHGRQPLPSGSRGRGAPHAVPLRRATQFDGTAAAP